MCKAGLAGEDAPSVLLESAVGHPGQDNGIRRPITHGVVTDWSAMEELWQHVFAAPGLGGATPSKGHPVLITEPPLNPTSNRELLAQHLFEVFDVPALHIAVPAVLTMYASGRATGTVLDSGDGVTHVVPVFEGWSVRNAVARADVAGGEITEYLARALSVDPETARSIKEKFCYVAADFTKESHRAQQGLLETKTFELPDGRILDIEDQRFHAPEGLFGPGMFGLEADGIHNMAVNCIKECDIDLRRLLYNNIILSGGNTMFSGIAERMRSEVASLSPSHVQVHVLAPSDWRYSVWIGGSILGSLSTFQRASISLAEYNEVGPAIVHTRDPLRGEL